MPSLGSVRAVLIVGAPGAGKSVVLQALSDVLADAGVEHGAIELEQLSWGHPWLSLAQAVGQLEAVVTSQLQFGRELFLVAATPETNEELERLAAAFSPAPVFVVALRAAPDTVAERILSREPEAWSGRRELATRARRLATAIPDLERVDIVVDTDELAPLEAAERIRAAALDPGPR